jgi:hypothetical protein
MWSAGSGNPVGKNNPKKEKKLRNIDFSSAGYDGYSLFLGLKSFHLIGCPLRLRNKSIAV